MLGCSGSRRGIMGGHGMWLDEFGEMIRVSGRRSGKTIHASNIIFWPTTEDGIKGDPFKVKAGDVIFVEWREEPEYDPRFLDEGKWSHWMEDQRLVASLKNGYRVEWEFTLDRAEYIKLASLLGFRVQPGMGCQGRFDLEGLE